MVCICNQEITRKELCVICKEKKERLYTKSMVNWQLCPEHKKIMICGEPEFVCKECGIKGWYSTAGHGGATQHINNKTGETISPESKYIDQGELYEIYDEWEKEIELSEELSEELSREL